MLSLRLSSFPLRRLLSAFIILSVLLTTLGMGHRPCGESAVPDDDAASTVPHADMAGMHDDSSPGRSDGQAPSRDCPDHDRHDGPGAGDCALTAHCAVGVVADLSLTLVTGLLPRAPIIEQTVAGPLEASYQPDSPPPKA